MLIVLHLQLSTKPEFRIDEAVLLCINRGRFYIALVPTQALLPGKIWRMSANIRLQRKISIIGLFYSVLNHNIPSLFYWSDSTAPPAVGSYENYASSGSTQKELSTLTGHEFLGRTPERVPCVIVRLLRTQKLTPNGHRYTTLQA